MYLFVQSRTVSLLLKEDAPALVGALIVAEVFFRFHSFTLECAGFLLTWYACGWALHQVKRLVSNSRA